MASRKTYRTLSLLVGITLFLTSMMRSQNNGGGLESFSDGLRRHHIALTEEAIKDALRNEDPEVRSLAALKLAEDKIPDAAPLIAAALRAEQVPSVRTNMASALLTLDEQQGQLALEAICSATNVNAFTRLDAARHLLDIKDGKCFDNVLAIAESDPDPTARMQALSFLPRFKSLPSYSASRVNLVLLHELEDETPAVRIAASSASASLKETSLIPGLEYQLRREKNQAVRKQLQNDLALLQNN